eukprot:29780-Pelagococcus_subviridis.AAC.1
MKWGLTEDLQKPHRSSAPQKPLTPREIGLKEVLQSSVISASARLTEICRGSGSLRSRYAPKVS